MTLAAVTALSMSCLLVENQHRRIAHLVLVRHFDEFFVCLLNPVSVVAVSGVDQTVHSPEILSPSRLNPVLASRQAKLKFLRPNFVMVVTISPSFSLKRIVVCLAASCSTIKIPASVLPTKRSQIMVVAKPTATNTRRRASLCPVPPGREFSQNSAPLSYPQTSPYAAAVHGQSSASKVHEPDPDLATMLPLLLPLPPLLPLPHCCYCSVTAVC